MQTETSLLRDRILGPPVYREARRPDYFCDPRLFWYVANNAKLVERMPSNVVEIAQTVIDRGVDAQTSITSADVAGCGRTAVACVDRHPAAHGERDIPRTFVANGEPLTAVSAATLAEDRIFSERLAMASAEDIHLAFGLAVINRERARRSRAMRAPMSTARCRCTRTAPRYIKRRSTTTWR